MLSIIAIGAGGAIGAILRYIMANSLINYIFYSIPIGILSCNVLGSFLLGILYSWVSKDGFISEDFRLFLQVGLIGSFTTFSTFALEVFFFTEKGEYTLAIIYILLSVFLSIIGLILGINIFRIFG